SPEWPTWPSGLGRTGCLPRSSTGWMSSPCGRRPLGRWPRRVLAAGRSWWSARRTGSRATAAATGEATVPARRRRNGLPATPCWCCGPTWTTRPKPVWRPRSRPNWTTLSSSPGARRTPRPRKHSKMSTPETMSVPETKPVPETKTLPEAAGGSRRLTISEALREAIAEEMRRDPDVFLIGEDIGVEGGFGGAFGVYLGLVEEFGHERMIDTPISEKAI